jgi:hypothetical protein
VTIHRSVVAVIRDGIVDATLRKSDKDLVQTMSDAQLIMVMFANVRGAGDDLKGTRLSPLGLRLMQAFFRSYDVNIQEARQHSGREILYLERLAVFPYFLGANKIVVFEDDLAISLTMLDGDLGALMRQDN